MNERGGIQTASSVQVVSREAEHLSVDISLAISPSPLCLYLWLQCEASYGEITHE